MSEFLGAFRQCGVPIVKLGWWTRFCLRFVPLQIAVDAQSGGPCITIGFKRFRGVTHILFEKTIPVEGKVVLNAQS